MASLSLVARLREQWSRRVTENPVFSLERQAAIPETKRERSQFQVLMRHIFARLFEGDTVFLEGNTQARVIQTASLAAFPGVLWAMARVASYHQPVPKSFWAQASDHYVSIVYSFVVMGAVAVFEWDLLFPDLLDCFVLATLPIPARKEFAARVSALGLLLGIFFLAANGLGSIFLCLWYWSMAKSEELYSPGYLGHLGPHLAAVTLSGIFAVALVVALQGVLIGVLGEGLFRRVSAALQSLLMALFLIVLFMLILLFRFLPPVLQSGDSAVRWFPPFWFLGLHERLLYGPSVEPIFHVLARTACWATGLAVLLAIATYPLAYRRKVRRTIEGGAARRKRARWTAAPLQGLLHRTVLRTPAKRAFYHFIGRTILRVERHRLYLAMYIGLGLSLVVSDALVLRLAHHRVALGLSFYGMCSAIPVIAFWTVSGLRTALVSPIDTRAGWIFRAIDGRPGLDRLAGTRTWVLLRAMGLTAIAIAALGALAPTAMHSLRAVAAQAVAGFGLCLLLVDIFFLNVMVVPFSEPRDSSRNALAFILVGYIVIFPSLVWNTVDLEPWLGASAAHLIGAATVIAALHFALRAAHRRKFKEQALLPDGDGELPLTLGLS